MAMAMAVMATIMMTNKVTMISMQETDTMMTSNSSLHQPSHTLFADLNFSAYHGEHYDNYGAGGAEGAYYEGNGYDDGYYHDQYYDQGGVAGGQQPHYAQGGGQAYGYVNSLTFNIL